MWNEKALRQTPKRAKMDEFDLAAEREGRAIRASNELRPCGPVGKALAKQRKMTDRGLNVQQNIVQRGTARVAREIIIGRV